MSAPWCSLEDAAFHTFHGKDGLRYQGRLKDGLLHGRAEVYHPDGWRLFDGLWSYGTPWKGHVYRQDSSLKYVGEVDRKLQAHGKGTTYDECGRREFVGCWKDGLRHGSGTGFHKNGNVCSLLTMVQGRPTSGSFYSMDGTLQYEGQVCHTQGVNTTPHGHGQMYDEQGRLLYVGQFANGWFQGTGTLYRGGTVLYEGDFRLNRPCGIGKIFRKDGTVSCEGEWLDGVFSREQTRKRMDEKASREVRQRVESLHADHPEALGEVPTCALCLDPIHHGDESHVFVPCGHRALCGPCGRRSRRRDCAWKTTCVMCKAQGCELVRVF